MTVFHRIMFNRKTSKIPTVHPTPLICTCYNHKKMRKKAKYLNLVRFIIVFIMCFGYFVYQMMLYNDTNYNQRQSTAIQKITSIHAPFVQVTTAVNTSSVMNCPIFVDSQHRWEN
eukprot:62261_1